MRRIARAPAPSREAGEAISKGSYHRGLVSKIRRPDGTWIEAPVVPGAFVVNSGDLQRHWTNGRFLSTPHRAVNRGERERYAIPFFFDCHADHVIECLPSCTGPDNPPRYPPITYSEYMDRFTRANYDHVRTAVAEEERA